MGQGRERREWRGGVGRCRGDESEGIDEGWEKSEGIEERVVGGSGLLACAVFRKQLIFSCHFLEAAVERESAGNPSKGGVYKKPETMSRV